MESRLDRQEEVQLFNRFHAGDNEAGDKIIEKHMDLVLGCVGKITRSGAFRDLREDLIQSGIEGLITARDRFESDRANGFSTYAYYWIRKFINETINSEKKFDAWHQLMSEANSENGEEEFSASLEERFGRNDRSADYATLRSDLETILTPFELYICHLTEQGSTMEAIGKSREVSRQRIHQLLKSARSKIQQEIT